MGGSPEPIQNILDGDDFWLRTACNFGPIHLMFVCLVKGFIGFLVRGIIYSALRRFVQKEHLTKERKALIDGLLPNSVGFYITKKIDHQIGNFFSVKEHTTLFSGRVFSNFSWMFLNPNNFFQYEF